MRLLIGRISMAVLLAGGVSVAGMFVAGGYLHTRRVEHQAADEHRALHAMSLQDLAAVIARCDAAPGGPRDGAPGGRDGAYCEAAARELDERPLQIVEVKP